MRKTCSKHEHKSEGAAEAHLRALVRQREIDLERFRVYFCAEHHAWHIGKRKLQQTEKRTR